MQNQQLQNKKKIKEQKKQDAQDRVWKQDFWPP